MRSGSRRLKYAREPKKFASRAYRSASNRSISAIRAREETIAFLVSVTAWFISRRARKAQTR